MEALCGIGDRGSGERSVILCRTVKSLVASTSMMKKDPLLSSTRSAYVPGAATKVVLRVTS